jgi:uridine kinase
MLKSPLPEYEELLGHVHKRLGPNRRPLLIGIDGRDGVGKSSLASWLGWQLEMPAVHLDLYLVRDSNPLQWRADELNLIIQSRLGNGRPIIVEGVMLLNALKMVGRTPDFLIYIRGEGGHGLSNQLAEYESRQKPDDQADFTIPKAELD